MKIHKIKACIAVAALLLSGFGVHAQQAADPVVIEVGNQQVRQSELMAEFNKNVGYRLSPEATFAERQQALIEYAELYATFLAKVQDAHERGFDTMARLQRELLHYRKDLAAPYLIDSTELRRLVREAYDRNHYSLWAKQILVNVNAMATPADTLLAYNKALDLYRRAAAGEDFDSVTVSHIRGGVHGLMTPYTPDMNDLGYFTVFEMVYPFETAAYGLKVGEVSKPVRSQYGYHIIKLLDRVEGLFGQVSLAHIWLRDKDHNNAQQDINNIYKQLEEGGEFSAMARLSDDRSTSQSGGVISNAQLSQLLPEYVHQLSKLQDGEYSKPFRTDFGWHIVKLLRHDTLPSTSNMEQYYKSRMTRDKRGEQSRSAFAAATRSKYGITLPAASLEALVKEVPDSVFRGLWDPSQSNFNDESPIVITPSQSYTVNDLAAYIARNQQKENKMLMQNYVQQKRDAFVDSVSIVYADSQLEKEYPEFARLVGEYRRGLMIFNYNDAMIWTKAKEDSIGFDAFYKRESVKKSLDNPDDSVFFFNLRARVSIYDVSNADVLPADVAMKIVKKAYKAGKGSSTTVERLRKKLPKQVDADAVQVEVRFIERFRQQVLKEGEWSEGVYLHQNADGAYRIIAVEEVLPRTLKGQKEARGYYLNAWQNEVEQQLDTTLRNQYHVKLNYDALRAISF